MQKFFIISESRSGYKWLATSICSHPEAFCFGEIFGSDYEVRKKSLFNQQNISAIKETENPVVWLKAVLEPWGKSRNLKALGFKINYADSEFNKYWYDLKKYLFYSGEYKVIHLTRENKIDRCLSELLATQENNFGKNDYKSTLNINLNLLMLMIHRTELWQWETRKILKNRFEITYEKIPESIFELQKYLGLNPITLTSNEEKQRKGKQSDYIVNYKELYILINQYFPCYRHMLEDINFKML